MPPQQNPENNKVFAEHLTQVDLSSKKHPYLCLQTLADPYGADTRNPTKQEQSYYNELVSFASLLAISRTFNSLSKVLFTFPSRYLFAIGLESIFSFRRQLPPILHSTSKERDSISKLRTLRTPHRYGTLTLDGGLFQEHLDGGLNW